MELKQLQYFVALAEYLNFTRAAESLYISQPRLSYQIAELEKELGCELFLRDHHKVFLTPSGAAALPAAREALRQATLVRDYALHGAASLPDHEPITIALDSTEDHFESTGVTERIAEFIRKYPDIEISLNRMPYDSCIRSLLLHQVDVSFIVCRYGEGLPDGLTYKVVHRDRLVLVVKKDPSVKTTEDILRKYAIVSVSDRPRGDTRVQHILEKTGVPFRTVQVDSIPSSFVYVQAGKGAIHLPYNYFRQHHYDDLMAVEIPDPAVEVFHVIAWNKDSLNSSIQLLANQFEAAPALPTIRK